MVDFNRTHEREPRIKAGPITYLVTVTAHDADTNALLGEGIVRYTNCPTPSPEFDEEVMKRAIAASRKHFQIPDDVDVVWDGCVVVVEEVQLLF